MRGHIEEDRGYVYFIQAGEGGPVKIGTALNPTTRVASLQTGHHAELRLLRTASGRRDIEARLHERFRHIHVRGEWYRWCDELRQFIETLPEVDPPVLIENWQLDSFRLSQKDVDRLRHQAKQLELEKARMVRIAVDGMRAAQARRERIASPEARRLAARLFAPGSPLARLTNSVREREAAREVTPAQADPSLYSRGAG